MEERQEIFPSQSELCKNLYVAPSELGLVLGISFLGKKPILELKVFEKQLFKMSFISVISI